MAYLSGTPHMVSTGSQLRPFNELRQSKLPCMAFNSSFNHLCFKLHGISDAKISLRWSQKSLCRVLRGRLSVNCRRTGGDGESSGEEPPETLFMKELKRRGMTPASLLEDNNRSPYGLGNKETKTREEGSEFLKIRNDRGTFTGVDDWGQFNQRARSMALNSEGLEGLIPRAKVLLTLGGTFFFIFWPLILTTLVFFSAVYIYFGPSFIHAGNKQEASQTYIDPNKLLEDERLSEAIPPRVPYISSQ